MIKYSKYHRMNGNNVIIFQKYERKMRDYMKNELNIEVENFSLYFSDESKYNFDFMIGSYFYAYFSTLITVDNFDDYHDSQEFNSSEFDSTGLDPDEYFNLSMGRQFSPVLLKDNTAKLRAKVKEVVNECVAEIKVLLEE